MNDWQEVSWDQARILASESVSTLESEEIDIASAIDRFSSCDLLALSDLPAFTTSSMDGWAVAGEGPWQIIGDVKAGAPHTDLLQDGTTVRIATGAVIPEGTHGVLRWEDAREEDGRIYGQVLRGAEIRPSGEECKKGDLLVSRGSQLTPAHIGLLAATGYDTVSVVRKPRIALLLLGDELLHSGIAHSGRVRDSLGPQLPGWFARLGAEIVSTNFVSDELETVITALKESLDCDLIVTTGGTADGPRDHIHNALAALGATFVVDRVRSRPGHPMLLASIPTDGERVSLLGLPGNPQSAIVGMMTLGSPLLNSFLGKAILPPMKVITHSEINAPTDFTRLVLGNLRDGYFEAGEHLGSAMLRGLAQSTGFAVSQSGTTLVGSAVGWVPLP